MFHNIINENIIFSVIKVDMMLAVIDYVSQPSLEFLQVNLDTVLNWIETNECLKIKKIWCVLGNGLQ